MTSSRVSSRTRVEPRIRTCQGEKTLFANWQEKLRDAIFGEDEKEAAKEGDVDRSIDNEDAVVTRLAARSFDKDSSRPSSRTYTTRKVELEAARVTRDGVEDDYNHYRTVALKSTQDRAVSILTMDVMKALRSQYPQYDIRDGDLGENVLIDNTSFDFFRVGKRYKFVDANDQSIGVVVEITQKMDPCANLCKLDYINDESLQPFERIERCKNFLEFLDRYDGYRGWYSKVIEEGVIPKGAKVVLVEE